MVGVAHPELGCQQQHEDGGVCQLAEEDPDRLGGHFLLERVRLEVVRGALDGALEDLVDHRHCQV